MPASPAAGAAEILREVYGSAEYGVTFRLWDGTEVRTGRQVCPMTVTFNSSAAFRRVFRNPTVSEFAEAYCDGDLDFEGDFIEAMKAADAFEEVQLPFLRRLAIAWKMRGIG